MSAAGWVRSVIVATTLGISATQNLIVSPGWITLGEVRLMLGLVGPGFVAVILSDWASHGVKISTERHRYPDDDRRDPRD